MYLTELIWLFVSFVHLPELRKVKICLLVGFSILSFPSRDSSLIWNLSTGFVHSMLSGPR